MDQLSYHSQLIVKKTVENKNQIAVLTELFKTGLNTNEAINIFTVLKPTIKMTDNQKSEFLCLANQLIINQDTKKMIIDRLNS